MANKKNEKTTELTPEQQEVAQILLNEGAKLERQAIIRGLEQYRGEAISVDGLIEALSKDR